MYNIPNNRYLAKSIPLLGNWFKAHWMRAGSGPHTTSSPASRSSTNSPRGEHGSGRVPDPELVQGNDMARKSQVDDQLLAVLNAVTQAAGWQPKVSASNLSERRIS